VAASGWVVGRRWAFGCLVFAVLALLGAFLDYDVDRELAGAPTAPATIVDVTRFAKGGPYLEVEVSLPDGRTVRTNISDFYDLPKPEKGGRIEVQYRPDGSGLLARENGIRPDRTAEIGWSVAGCAALVVGVALLVRRTRGRRLRH
jgi:hypothetical protein